MKDRRPLHELGELQRQVMEILWDLEEGGVHEVRRALPGNPAYTTVLSVLQKLDKAGWVKHRKEGRSHVFSAARSRESEGRTSVISILDRVFSGKPKQLFQHMLEADRLDESDLKELSRMIAAKRKELGHES